MARPRKTAENQKIVDWKDKSMLSYREIAKLLNTHPSNIYRRYLRHKALL